MSKPQTTSKFINKTAEGIILYLRDNWITSGHNDWMAYTTNQLNVVRKKTLEDVLEKISELLPTPEQEKTIGEGNWFAGRAASYEAVKKLWEAENG